MPELSTHRHGTHASRRAVSAALALVVVAALAACSSPAPAPAGVPNDSEVDTTFTSDDGLAVTLTDRICGISGVGADKPEFTPVGQYCTVGVNVDNETGEAVDLVQLKVSGWIGETQYFPDYWAGNAADGGMQALAAGESIKSTLFFDVPKGQALERAAVATPWVGLEAFEVRF